MHFTCFQQIQFSSVSTTKSLHQTEELTTFRPQVLQKEQNFNKSGVLCEVLTGLFLHLFEIFVSLNKMVSSFSAKSSPAET